MATKRINNPKTHTDYESVLGNIKTTPKEDLEKLEEIEEVPE